MLTSEQISAYFENGYLLVEDVVTPEQLQRMQEITHEFIDRSRHVTASNDVYDLDEGQESIKLWEPSSNVATRSYDVSRVRSM